MAAFIYDGKSNLTVTSADTVVLNLDPTLFTQASQIGPNAALQFGSNTLTVTGATLSSTGANSLQNVSLAGGTFSVATAGANTLTTANSLIIGTDTVSANYTTLATTTADSKNALFGGGGISGPNDGADSFAIGGKGSFLVYGNGGVDQIAQNGTAFDSTSAVTVFGGKGGDSINLSAATNKGSLLILGGEDADTIKIVNAGTTTIFGGTGAGDSADGADSIGLIGSGGTITVYANGGADVINGDATTANFLTSGTAFVDGTKATIYGGTGNDSVNVTFAANAKGTVTVYGGEDADTILVSNTGTTTVYGGTGQGDSTDGADNIVLNGSGGSVTVFGNAGNDIISGAAGTAGTVTTFANGVNATIYGGRGNDSINVGYDATTSKGTINVYGGEDQDSITVANTAGSATTVFGGLGQGDTTDGADTITITGQGTATVFGNGGNDTINLGGFTGASGAASVNVVTVYGGTGNDSINIGTVTAGQSTFNLNGNEGADTFIQGTTVQEVASTTFTDLAANGTFTIAGVQVTAGAGAPVTAATLANAFAGKAAGAAITIAGATTTGTLTGYSTGANASQVVAFTSTTDGNVTDLAATGAQAASAAAVVTTQGVATNGTGAGVSINDFTVGTDLLRIQNGITGTGTAPTITVVPANGFADLQSALNAASSNAAAGSIGVVAFGGSTYVVTNNDGVAGYSATADLSLKLTGITDVNGVVNAITVL